MTTSNPSPAMPARPLARLGETHGYRIESDAVHLHATLRDIERPAHDRSWALQLWACPALPRDAAALVGHLVAEAWLPPLAEFEEHSAEFAVVATATPPAGRGEWVMVLVLVAARGELFDEVHDLASYPRHESFVQPSFDGGVRCAIAHDTVRLEVAAIVNPRAAENISGTLSLELWALSQPYAGGRFEGSPLAGAVLGTLVGQERWSALALDLPYVAPPAGTWHPVVMLREWIGGGYVTRDFASAGPPIVATATEAPATAPAAAKKPRARKPATAAAPSAPKKPRKKRASES